MNLKNADFSLSKVILGLWRLDDISGKESANLINFALDQGINWVDQADIYGGYKSQLYFGRALKGDASLRKKLKIVSKTGIILPGSAYSKSGIGYYNSSQEHVIASVNQTLKDLGTDYIDLLLFHRPDLLTNPAALDETFKKLKKEGKVLHFGVSNYTPSQFDMLQQNMDTKLQTNQVEFSVLIVDPLYDGTFDNCMLHKIQPMIWSPLGGGGLFTNSDEATIMIRKVLAEVGEELQVNSIDEVALAWIMKHPSNPAIIIGTLKTERIKKALAASKIEMSHEQWYRILIVAQGHTMP